MADMAASAILDGRGNSGDLVRVVVDVVLTATQHREPAQLDEVYFWRTDRSRAENLDDEGVIALTKVFSE